jgi:opacity protein-like surface antigen
MSIKKNLFIGVVALGLSPIVLANGYMPPADTWAPGIYVGLQGGYGMTNWDAPNNVAILIAEEEGVTTSGVSDSDAFVGRLSLGYDFHKNFAIEAGYAYFFNNPSVIFNGVESHVVGNTYAIDLMGVIKANVVDNFGLYAKAGIACLHTGAGDKIVAPNGYTYQKNTINNFNVAYGAGAYYDITQNVSVDASWLRYNGDQHILTDDYQPYADLFMIGIKYKFII